MLEETKETGVIYKITNSLNNKIYIGKANSYVKNKEKYYKHGIKGRFSRHIKNALNGSNEIPLLYNDIRIHGKTNFNIEIIEICLKEELKNKETYYIKLFLSYDNNIGYNYFVGDNKPQDKNHIIKYKENKVTNNINRAKDGKLRKSEETRILPQNIYKRYNGYFVQIKIKDKLYNKSFLSSKDTEEERLKKSIIWLEEIKKLIDNPQPRG
jgi:hypothetical protein